MPSVALFGASVRALAQSARAAGYRVFACDLFGDEDLVECCEQAVRLDRRDYPSSFQRVADAWPGMPRAYTGGLENFPDIVAHLARTGPLWGCLPNALRPCRDPTALPDSGVKTPAVALSAADVPADGTWLLKPKAGSGGRGIRPWFGGPWPAESFLQQRVTGEPCSASFLATADRTILIGAASQCVGEPWTGAPPFAYAGGIAPLVHSAPLSAHLTAMGEALRARFSLRGLFGVDAVRSGDDWTIVELNPRPTASMELFELSGLGSMFAPHGAAFAGGQIEMNTPSRTAGKAILYASQSCCLLERLPAHEESWSYADRPAVETSFATGDPVATVLATGDSTYDVAERLRNGIEKLRARCATNE